MNKLTNGVIQTESKLISIRDLSYFLYHFRAVYVEALKYMQREKINDVSSEAEIGLIAINVADMLANNGSLGISRNALADLSPEEELNFSDISRRNPLDIVFSCVGVALATSVIISGGEIKWDKDGFRVKLPPLGKGIAEIKKAISGSYEQKSCRKPGNTKSPPSP